jgi:hypothetical protein
MGFKPREESPFAFTGKEGLKGRGLSLLVSLVDLSFSGEALLSFSLQLGWAFDPGGLEDQ